MLYILVTEDVDNTLIGVISLDKFDEKVLKEKAIEAVEDHYDYAVSNFNITKGQNYNDLLNFTFIQAEVELKDEEINYGLYTVKLEQVVMY